MITAKTLTKDVVRNIVIPETSNEQSCYMASDFMMKHGGGKRAQKLVSHWWDSELFTTVLNILSDASGFDLQRLKEQYVRGDKFDADSFRKNIGMERRSVLENTYWLCIFAVNEHRCICGDCWTCNDKPEWKSNLPSFLEKTLA
ncbi:unnamed protein product [Prorocentrum cordatum]|uniref:Uncharacterized protein n=1 Tax=Prorocentrum cordatum TaxID=2364126 RepID=A0ABN9TFB4_9DINO|nr:unnamed protein product [Polarella glacialis]